MPRVWKGFVAIALVLLPGQASAQTFIPSDEERIHRMVDATRAEHGLAALSRSGALDQVAREQSSRMAEQQDLFHNPRLAAEINAGGLDWLWIGENVGVGPGVVTIHEAFVASVGHYENIIRPNYDTLGVGVVSDPDGRVYVTQVFAQLGSVIPYSAPPAPPTTTPSRVTPVSPSPPKTPLPPSAPRSSPIAIEGGVVVPAPPFGSVEPDPRSELDLVTALFRRILGVAGL